MANITAHETTYARSAASNLDTSGKALLRWAALAALVIETVFVGIGIAAAVMMQMGGRW